MFSHKGIRIRIQKIGEWRTITPDWVLYPMSAPGTSPAIAIPLTSAGIFGSVVGTGQGAGMGLMFVIRGILGTLVGLGGHLFPTVRNAEDLLPDYDAVTLGPPCVEDRVVK